MKTAWRYGSYNWPNKRTILNFAQKFENNSTLLADLTPMVLETWEMQTNVQALRQRVGNNPNYVRRRSRGYWTKHVVQTWRILRKVLGLHPYEIFFSNWCYKLPGRYIQGRRCVSYRQRIACIYFEKGNGFVNYPAWFCVLIPCNFFLWGYVKSKIYTQIQQQ